MSDKKGRLTATCWIAMTYNIWAVPLRLPFPDFGPPLYTGAGNNPKRGLGARAMTQAIGLKPEGCVIENVNWCGFMPPNYGDQKSCYQVSCPYIWLRSLSNTLLTGYSPLKIAQYRQQAAIMLLVLLAAKTALIGRDSALQSGTIAVRHHPAVAHHRYPTSCQRH